MKRAPQISKLKRSIEVAKVKDAPAVWRDNPAMISEIAGYLDKVEINYMNHHVLNRTATNAAKLYRKLFDSLSYFRRSFKSRGDEDEQVTNLAIAFEVLITTEYARGVGKRFERRIALALSLHPDSKRLTTATKNRYKVRSELVHQGATETEYDLARAQEAFGQIFLSIMRKVDQVSETAQDFVGVLLGDKTS